MASRRLFGFYSFSGGLGKAALPALVAVLLLAGPRLVAVRSLWSSCWCWRPYRRSSAAQW
ncbi:hypothetical protein [Pseudorhodoferax sp.]|uniref:hypothetical protein n=1 Tax=Pseudorhodoferax sp. TaxID=1993553 RepID=UPI0039E55591